MMRKAFTMLELVFVIVILGIVASIGADIIASLYKNYLKTRSINRLQSQTELVLDQIAKRMQYRIKDSVRAIDTTGKFVPLPDANSSYTILEWVGYSNESFLGGWTGFIDLDSNETNASVTPKTLKTSGSDLNTTDSIINALSYGDVSLTLGGLDSPAIIFKGKSDYNISKYYTHDDDDYTVKVKRKALPTNDVLVIDDDNVSKDEIFEQYWLSHSAFAIVPVLDGGVNDFNLTLRYNYQPWEGESYNNIAGVTLMEHVSTFRFTQVGETIRIKLCINDDNRSGDYNFAFCKERVIY